MSHIVHCRVCKREMDIDATTDWMMPSTNYYYHTKCYASWIKKRGERAVTVDRPEDEWFDMLKDYLWKDLKLPGLDWAKIHSQWKNFVKNKYTPKGIYFAVIYFYEISHGDPSKAKGGIGIVSSVYNDSKEYWSNLEIKREGTLEGIIQQIATRQNRPIRTVRDTTRRNVPRLKYRLDDIEGD